MRKIIYALIISALVMSVFVMPVSAQNNSGSIPNMYYISLPIEKIYPSSEGYVVVYRKGNNQTGIVGVPNNWFTEAAGRAEMLRLPTATAWPTMSVFYSDGQFSHVRIYVHKVKRHQTWGLLPASADLGRIFSDTESFNIEF